MKNFKINKDEIERMIPDIGFCYATDKITVDGNPVDYMSRQEPDSPEDSGWVFYGGGETQEYMDNADNIGVYSVNTIANYDPEIIQFLTYPPGTEIERKSDGELAVLNPDIPEPDVVFFHPVDRGLVQITADWSFEVLERMCRRYDDGSLVIWKPGFTIWMNSYSIDDDPKEKIIDNIIKTKSAESTDFKEVEVGGLTKLRYHLEERNGPEVQCSYYFFGITNDNYLQMSLYYDSDEELEQIENIWETLKG